MSLLSPLAWVPALSKRTSFFKGGRLLSHFIHPGQEDSLKLEAFATFHQPVSLEKKVSGTRSITYTFSLIALAAKLAKIDGLVTKEEVDAFYRYFPMPAGGKAHAAELFYEAHDDPADSRLYARKIVTFYGDDQAVLLEVLLSLIKLATADVPMNVSEFRLLKKIADTLLFSDEEFSSVLREYFLPPSTSPYTLLGIEKQAKADAVKQAYRRAAREYHPDMLQQYDIPKEILVLMQENFNRLTIAYDMICKKRKFK